MRRRDLLGAMAMCGLLVACGDESGSSGMTKKGYFFPAHRFRLTAEVETPEGVRRGSSVIQVRWSISSYEINGEAAAVDLPGGQTLFVLLRSKAQESADWAGLASSWIPQNLKDSWVLPNAENSASSIAKGKYYWGHVARYRGTVPVPRLRKMPWGEIDNYPYFVKFKDIRDPGSVELVDPDNFAASFGTGYRLKSLTATFTAEPVTHIINSRLGWLAEVGRTRATLQKVPRYDPKAAEVPVLTPTQRISPSDFSRNLYK